jgi:hypothetical protein
MHEPLEGIGGADAILGRPFPLPSAALPLARWVDVVQVAERGVEVAWNLDDTLAEAQASLRPVTELRWERDGLHLRLTAQGAWEIETLLALARSV